MRTWRAHDTRPFQLVRDGKPQVLAPRCRDDLDGDRQRLEQAGYRCHAVLDIRRITMVLHRAGRLSDAQAAVLGEGVLAAS